MHAADLLLRQLEEAWNHRWESLGPTLEGVGEAEATWQAPCYAAEPREEGWPPPGTVHWHVAHLAHCKAHYANSLRGRGDATAPAAPTRAGPRTWAEDRAALDEAHEAQCAALAECRDADLATRLYGKTPIAEFVSATIRHDAWHGAQIAVARRLWRTRG